MIHVTIINCSDIQWPVASSNCTEQPIKSSVYNLMYLIKLSRQLINYLHSERSQMSHYMTIILPLI